MNWNFDISQAPRGKMVATTVQTKDGPRQSSRFVPDRIILATKCNKVTLSHYLPDDERWLMLGKDEQPVAWMAWPEHPNSSDRHSPALANSPAFDPSAPGSHSQVIAS